MRDSLARLRRVARDKRRSLPRRVQAARDAGYSLKQIRKLFSLSDFEAREILTGRGEVAHAEKKE